MGDNSGKLEAVAEAEAEAPSVGSVGVEDDSVAVVVAVVAVEDGSVAIITGVGAFGGGIDADWLAGAFVSELTALLAASSPVRMLRICSTPKGPVTPGEMVELY